MRVLEYVDQQGHSPFNRWFMSLDSAAAVRVSVQLFRLQQGNLASLKGVGEGVLESRIDQGPGYRFYLAFDGKDLIILLAGGTKRRQAQDIEDARHAWRDYRQRKKGGLT